MTPDLPRYRSVALVLLSALLTASCAPVPRTAGALRGLAAALRYLFLRKGVLAMGASYAAGFLRTDPALKRPDIQAGLAFGAFGPAPLDLRAVEGRHPGAVVTAIFEPPQTVEDARSDFLGAEDADDATHGRGLSCR